MLSLMTKQGLINRGDWLDWGCGVGAVSQLLNDYFDLKLSTYDKYFTPHINAIDETALLPRQFDLVVNTAVFEHVRDRDTLDEIESYVSDKGCFAIHTLVPENVPQDPNWMYLIPVHCAFHTNKSMALLMKDWGYQCSVYNQHSKMWVLFREPAAEVQPRVEQLNHALGWQYLHFKNGFMDYWQ
ncbi:methyltransferase domain-containing protein [Neiella sp. HB171785]|uniref:Methyltransferase domain-containing protein n=2 Tax=Neiella litorisoli TaxID=2771431 RepID=A0A8J6QKA6_9GAMM|nr:methyltransferase domain-containing protein [Neiella litorisoli]